MQIKNGDLFKHVTSGIIVHQVNCCSAMGAGFAQVFYKKYPEIKKAYHDHCRGKTKDELLGDIQLVTLTPELTGVNLFTQKNYGNSKRTGVQYTDMPLLIKRLKEIVKVAGKPVYAPYGIGCGLAGGDWAELEDALKDVDITFYKL